MRKTRVILSIDGGGIRGVLPLVILDYLNAAVKKHGISKSINEAIDLFAGTSTGAIISSALMLKKKNGNPLYFPDNIIDLYAARGPQIFNKARPENKNEFPLKLILENNFGSTKMADLDKRFAFISYDERMNEPFVFTNRLEGFRNVSLAKILLACSAVKDYFPPIELGGHLLSDGIKTTKNPALTAYHHAKVYFPNDVYLIISLGTGKMNDELRDDVEINAENIDKELVKQEKADKDLIYYRFQPDIKEGSFEMDDTDPENINALIRDGELFVRENRLIFNTLIKEWKKSIGTSKL